MIQGFDEWFDEEYGKYSGQSDKSKAKMFVSFEAGAESRQAEIDGLNALNEMSEQKIDDLVFRNIELQKRIDFLEKGLSTVIRESGFIGYREIRGLCRSLLKGESNE